MNIIDYFEYPVRLRRTPKMKLLTTILFSTLLFGKNFICRFEIFSIFKSNFSTGFSNCKPQIIETDVHGLPYPVKFASPATSATPATPATTSAGHPDKCLYRIYAEKVNIAF